MALKNRKAVRTAFGVVAGVLADLPAKVGNVRVARLLFHRARGGCSYCFPHGHETTNASRDHKRRSWKHYRRSQYRPRDAEPADAADPAAPSASGTSPPPDAAGPTSGPVGGRSAP